MCAFADIEYLRKTLPPTVEDEFFQYLRNLTPNDITIYALKEGSIAFPRRGRFTIQPSYFGFILQGGPSLGEPGLG